MSTEPQHGDSLLDGRVRLLQPRAPAYRAAIDPVLLAAAVPARSGDVVVDLGAGAGTAALCLAARVAGVEVVGIECDAALVEMAERNAAASGVAGRVRFVCADVNQLPDLAPCHHVMINPPYLPPERAAPARRDDTATVEGGATLGDWVLAALRLLRPKGSLTSIHRADRLDDLLATLHGRAGEVVVCPLWPKAGRVAKRVLVRARKRLRTPLRLEPGLVLHEADGRYTDAAEAVLRRAAPLAMAAVPGRYPC